MRFTSALFLFCLVGFVGKLEAQPLSSPVQIPLYNWSSANIPNDPDEDLVIYAAFNTTGAPSGSYPYVLDTGSFGFESALGTSSFWTNSTANLSQTPYTIDFDGGLTYSGTVALSTVTLTDSVSPSGTVALSGGFKIPNTTFGIITNQPDANWTNNINSNPPIGPEKASTFGTLGAGLFTTGATNGNLTSVLGQIPISSSSGLDQGYIIHSGGATASGAYVQVGMTQTEVGTFTSLSQMQASTTSYTTSTGQTVNIYPENQLTGTITLVDSKGDTYSGEVLVVVDSGGLGSHLIAANSGPNNFTPPSEFLNGTTGFLADGINFTLTTTGTNGASGLDWSFTTGSTPYVNRVASPGTTGSFNTGIAIYHNYDVMFDTTKGLVGFNPLNIELNSTTLVYQGSYLYQGFGTFNDTLGTGLNQIQWTGSGGFAAQGGNLTVNLNGLSTPQTMTWGITPNFITGGNTLYFGSATSDSTVIFQNGLDLNGQNQTIVVTQGVSTTAGVAPPPGANITGNITDGSLTVGDPGDVGTLVLSGTNTYNCGTTIAAGTLEFAQLVSMSPTGTITVDSGATLAVNVGGPGEFTNATSGNGSIGGLYSGLGSQSGSTVVFQAGSAVGIDTTNAGGSVTYSGNITNIGVGLTKLGTGTLILTGTNTYTGATTIADGTLEVDGSLGAATLVAVTTYGTLSGSGTINGSATLTGAGSIDLGSTGQIGGTLEITGGNWAGLGSVAGQVTSSSGDFTIGPGANLTANGGLAVTGGTLSSADKTGIITGDVVYTSPSDSTFEGRIEGDGNTVTVNSAGATLTLSGTNTYTGGTTIAAGTLEFEKTFSMPATGDVLVQSGATLAVGVGATDEFTTATSGNGSVGGVLDGLGGRIGSTGTVTFQSGSSLGIDTTDAGSTVTYAGDITNVDLGITKLGTGILLLTGTNTYTGDTTIAAGELQVRSDTEFGTGAINFTGGSLQYGTGYTQDLSSRFGTSAGQQYSIDTNGQTVTLASALDSVGGSLTKLGDGTLFLTGTNTYDGGTTVEGGILSVANESKIGGANAGGLTFNGGEFVTTDTAPTFEENAQLANGATSTLAAAAGTVATYAGIFSDNGSNDGTLVIGDSTNTGTIVTTGANNYSASTDVQYGTLRAGAVDSFSPYSSYTVERGATLDLNNDSQVVSSLAGRGTVELGSGTLTTGGEGVSSLFSGVITGTGGIILEDDTFTLSGTNTYTGPTTIAGGFLVLNNREAISSSSAIIMDGGTFSLHGYSPDAFTNPLTVEGNGSKIDFGATQSSPVILQFADSSGVTWTGPLDLLDFTVGTDEIGFDDSTGLTLSQLSDIELAGYTATGLDGSGFVEFSNVPEPSHYGAFVVLALATAFAWRRFSRSDAAR